jgi:uncharacterized protein YneF (UPF0154 family)
VSTAPKPDARMAALAIAILCGVCLVLGFGLGFLMGRGL